MIHDKDKGHEDFKAKANTVQFFTTGEVRNMEDMSEEEFLEYYDNLAEAGLVPRDKYA